MHGAPRQGLLPAANRIFVDREIPQRIFEKAVFSIPSDRSILRVFYGVGGQGKTALCRELMRKTDASSEPTYAFLRRAELDLHGRTKEDPDKLLVWIRNGFADSGVAFPCFDLAFALTWEATRGEEPLPKFTKQWLGRTTSLGHGGVEEAASWAQDAVIELVGAVPGVGFALKKIGHWGIEKSKRYYLERTKEAVQQLYDGGVLKKPYELSRLLPWMLAQDLNAHLTSNPTERFVLFIDEYERVFDEGGAGAQWEENPFDRNLRDLVAETNGMLAVFFSREQLPWGADPSWRDDLRDNQYLLGGLSDKDADSFLVAIPIEDQGVRSAIISGARETSQPDAPVYPLMLDLQVEHWRSLLAAGAAPKPDLFKVAADSFEDRRREIVTRVLRDYGTPLETTLLRLSVSRKFDRRSFECIVREHGTALPYDHYDRIAELSFITKGEDGFLTIHNAIAEAIRQTLTFELRTSSIDSLLRHFEERATAETIRDINSDHVSSLMEAAYLQRAKGVEGYVPWLNSVSARFVDAGRYIEAESLWHEAVSIADAQLGAHHPDTGMALSNLASLAHSQGDFAAAKPLFERSLAICEKELGPDHPNTAAAVNNLASLAHAQGDFATAKPLFERALTISEAVLGPDHPDTAISLSNLAGLLLELGDLATAKPFFERALTIDEETLGPHHPDTATSLNNLAGLLQAQGNLAAATPLFERSLAIHEKVLGPEHHETARILNNLAGVLEAQGDLATAKPLLQRSLEICEKMLGPDHPDTARSLNNLAGLYKTQGDFIAAKPLFERSLAICEKALGPNHPRTARDLSNLASLLQAQGDFAAAGPLFQRALDIHEKALGPDHLDTAMSFSKLANLFEAQGDIANAILHRRRALEIRKKKLELQNKATRKKPD